MWPRVMNAFLGGSFQKSKAPVQRVPLSNFPFEKVGIDAIGTFVTSIEGNKHLIIMTDYFTKYAEVYPVKNIQSSTVCKVLIDFISRHGIMRVLYSDRGSNFISATMQEVYELLGISKQQCLSYSPQGNGAVERLNKTLRIRRRKSQKNVAPLPKNKLIEVGDVVYLNTPKIKIHSSKKLSKLNEDPFRVITKHSPVIFEIKHLNKPENVQKVHLNRIFKVPERAIFEWESPSNTELEITVDVSPTSVQRLPSEEEILKEFPPYTLPLETGNFLEEENYENQGNLVNLSDSSSSSH
ncbi:reverse transcriptase [Caerostris extrusa]|uniref:Reverse transcriptase n=1 Tax=Caerostris extrusa TaxID=172846 RepID=A0AAV4P3D1_CAEEX|nr:reverse transcriptase [Caerostris extrusa]